MKQLAGQRSVDEVNVVVAALGFENVPSGEVQRIVSWLSSKAESMTPSAVVCGRQVLQVPQ